MEYIQLRINGRGNAWPVLLGQDHPFYNRNNYEDMANASCSIIKSGKENPTEKDIEWEFMIDAGHGAVQHLLKYCNRIPDALFITHPHIDHTLGVDWIVQSYYRTFKKKYPVYATMPCWKKTVKTFPQLEKMVNFKELIPFKQVKLDEIQNVYLTPFPVYHGNSAEGASMFLFKIKAENQVSKVLITGDILCPLLREQDYKQLQNIDFLVTDANNRYPYPQSNHWSVVLGKNNNTSEYLSDYLSQITIHNLLKPHLKGNKNNSYCKSFDYFIHNKIKVESFEFCINSFIKKIKASTTIFLHYSGAEDEKFHNEQILNQNDLVKWLISNISWDLLKAKFELPYVNQHIKLLSV